MFFLPHPPASRPPFPISVELGRGDIYAKTGFQQRFALLEPCFCDYSERVDSSHSLAAPTLLCRGRCSTKNQYIS